jgi:hypothetical protein
MISGFRNGKCSRISNYPGDGKEKSHAPMFLALKEGHNLGLFENWVPRKIFGFENEEIRDWGDFH